MKLRLIRLQNFRNIADAALDFRGDRVFLVGSNGQGKTNLLEAISYVSALRAFRPGDNRVLIREGASEAAIAYTFEHEKLGATEAVIRIRPRGKEATFDGNPVRRLAEFIGRFPTVLFASDDIQLVRGGPVLRRRWLDLHLATLEPDYLAALQTYHRALDHRNRLLKTSGSAEELSAFEQRLAPAAAVLVARRAETVKRLAESGEEYFAGLTGAVDTATFSYAPDVTALTAKEFIELFEQQRTKDRKLGATQHGPHRDDIALHVNARHAQTLASEGQQRALVLAMRFAQLREARQRSGVAPIVLADDVLGELDPVRRTRFWATLDGDVQLFATGTTTPPEAGDGGTAWELWRVERGGFTRVSPACA